MLGAIMKGLGRLLLLAGFIGGGVLAYRKLTAAGSTAPSGQALPEAPLPPQKVEDLLPLLACPTCRGPLRLAESELICDACRLAYPIEDGIPDLLPDSGRPITP